MKIEKVNENQIRCTLTREDLADRELKISELAYGTEKAKNLFRDMMQQASFDFGFEADDLPLMIEAIPASSDSIVLIITKVEDPEELDTRFSKFTPFGDSDPGVSETFSKLEGAEDFLDLLDKVKEATAGISSSVSPLPEPDISTDTLQLRLFSFENIDRAIQASRLVAPIYCGENTLYHNEENGMYILALTHTDDNGDEFNKVCNMLSEFGSVERTSGMMLAYLEEHWETALSVDAIQNLADI